MNEPSLQALLQARLDRNPEGRALTFYTARGEYAWQTFEEFYAKAASSAARLADHGLRKGDVCILVLPSNELSATLLMSVLLLGGLPLLIAPPSLQGVNSNLLQIVTRTVRRTRARLVICPESMRENEAELIRRNRRSRFLFGKEEVTGGRPESIPPVLPQTDELAALQLTSGTTGFPRVCMWKQKNVVAALDGMVKAMKLTSDDICLNWTPLYHDMGLVNNFFLCMTAGVPLVMLSPLDFVRKPALWLRSLSDTDATTTWSPNFGFAITAQRAREQELEGVRLDKVRAFWNAAERIHLETIETFYERFRELGVSRAALKTNFGCAENVGGATFSDPDGEFVYERVDRELLQNHRIAQRVDSPEADNAIAIVSAGMPHPDMRIHILSPRGKILPEGHVGEIGLETPSRMVGYLNNKRATQRAVGGQFLRTGDLGYLRGNELFWVGRVKERLAVRGKKLDPSDFEPILLKVEGLRQGCFAAFGVDDEKQGTQQIVLVTEVRDNNSRSPEEIANEIRDQVYRQIGLPVDDVVLVRQGTLTKTSSGKRRHRHFREMYLAGKLEPFQITRVAA